MSSGRSSQEAACFSVDRTKYLMVSKWIPDRSAPHVGIGCRSNSLSAFSRRSSIHCGSLFLSEMSRTTSSSTPRRAEAPALSLSDQPNAYRPSVSMVAACSMRDWLSGATAGGGAAAVAPLSQSRIEQAATIDTLGRYAFGWSDSDKAGASARRGVDEDVVRDISDKKSEPQWMLERRLKALKLFERQPMPTWGADLSGIHFDTIKYFVRSTEKQAASWEDLPDDIKNTYDRLGIPEAEKQRLVGGVAAQYESEVVYHQIQEDLERQGVIFLDTDSGLREHPEIFEKYFGSVIPSGDNKFSALNSAVWSGGSFVYVPPGVHVDIPLQAYFRINTENMGQFARTLIIVDEDAYVHYVEGCTAPIYKSDSLHSAVVEIIVKKGGRCRYTTIQNWSNNVYNLVTKRAKAEAGATMEWVDGNIGSKVTMKYPSVWLMGEHAKGEVLSIAFAGEGQHQDTGAKMLQ